MQSKIEDCKTRLKETEAELPPKQDELLKIEERLRSLTAKTEHSESVTANLNLKQENHTVLSQKLDDQLFELRETTQKIEIKIEKRRERVEENLQNIQSKSLKI